MTNHVLASAVDFVAPLSLSFAAPFPPSIYLETNVVASESRLGELDKRRILAVRDRFPGTQGGAYLDASARGLLYDDARAVLVRYLDQNVKGTLSKSDLFAGVERTRSLFAALIGAAPDEIAFTRNVTDAIATLAASLPWQGGDNVVICESLEHPANIFPWYGVARRFGITVKTVTQKNGHILLADILAQLDQSTRVVAVSAVSFAPGFRFAVARLGEECRRRNILLIVDAAQSAGIIATDVVAMNVDVLAASTQKYLMGLYGMGFLYVREAVAESLHPILLSRFGVDLEGQHEASAGDAASYRLARGARRFDVGNYNYPAILAVGASLDLLLDIGSAAVEAYVCGLATIFAHAMIEAGLPVYGGPPGPHTSQIIAVGNNLGTDHDAATDPEISSLYAHLSERGVRLGIRRDLLRFSFHIYNNEDDIAAVVDMARTWRRTRHKTRE